MEPVAKAELAQDQRVKGEPSGLAAQAPSHVLAPLLTRLLRFFRSRLLGRPGRITVGPLPVVVVQDAYEVRHAGSIGRAGRVGDCVGLFGVRDTQEPPKIGDDQSQGLELCKSAGATRRAVWIKNFKPGNWFQVCPLPNGLDSGTGCRARRRAASFCSPVGGCFLILSPAVGSSVPLAW